MATDVLQKSDALIPCDVVDTEIDKNLVFSTDLGMLFEGSCLQLLPKIKSNSIDTVFADPPFNLSKEYGPGVDDALSDSEYISWCKEWLDESIRVLKHGGAIFVYNLPKWNIFTGNYLSNGGLIFRHWIAVNIKLSFPIPGRLYPSHYSLL